MNRRERVQAEISELKQEWKYLSSRIRGVQTELSRTMSGEQEVVLQERLDDLKRRRSEVDGHLRQLENELQQLAATPSGQRVFISYRRHNQPDDSVAMYLARFLSDQGKEVFIDQRLKVGMDWVNEVQSQIAQADFLIILLSPESVRSEMVLEEVRFADQQWRETGRPRLLPIRLNFTERLPHPLEEYLAPLQYLLWQGELDTLNVAHRLLNAMAGKVDKAPEEEVEPVGGLETAETGRPAPDDIFDILEPPNGPVGLNSPFYIEHRADRRLKRALLRSGTTTTIRAPRQMGKTSLLIRGIEAARQQEQPIIFFDFQVMDTNYLNDLDKFLRYLATTMALEMDVDLKAIEVAWQRPVTSKDRLSYFLETYILAAATRPIVFAIDEADRLFETSFRQEFFSLLRAWHNLRFFEPLWKNLNVVLVISTQPYLLIDDIDQSPFNVGLRLELEDFTPEQARNLNERHGNPLQAAEVDEMMTFLSGHRYLVRQALYSLVDSEMSWAILVNSATKPSGPFDSHLRRYLWRLQEKPELLAAFKEILTQQHCSDEIALIRLTAVGLVKQDESGRYRCRCQLYDRYFRQHLR